MSQRRDLNLGPLALARVVEDLAGGPKVKASNPSQEKKEWKRSRTTVQIPLLTAVKKSDLQATSNTEPNAKQKNGFLMSNEQLLEKISVQK